MYFRGAAVVLIVYDIGNVGSFNNVQRWKDEALLERGHEVEQPLVVIVGNKADLEQCRRQVTASMVQQFSEQNPDCLFFQVSAKTGHNVKAMFQRIGTFARMHVCACGQYNVCVCSSRDTRAVQRVCW